MSKIKFFLNVTQIRNSMNCQLCVVMFYKWVYHELILFPWFFKVNIFHWWVITMIFITSNYVRKTYIYGEIGSVSYCKNWLCTLHCTSVYILKDIKSSDKITAWCQQNLGFEWYWYFSYSKFMSAEQPAMKSQASRDKRKVLILAGK